MEAQGQTSKALQVALKNFQQILAQFLNNQNNNETSSNPDEEENLNNEYPKTENSKRSSSIDANVIKGIQAQIASLSQRDELKKVRMMRPHQLEWDSVPYPSRFKSPMLHMYDGKSSPKQHIYYFRSQTDNVINSDAIIAKLFIGTLKGCSLIGLGAFLMAVSILGLT